MAHPTLNPNLPVGPTCASLQDALDVADTPQGGVERTAHSATQRCDRDIGLVVWLGDVYIAWTSTWCKERCHGKGYLRPETHCFIDVLHMSVQNTAPHPVDFPQGSLASLIYTDR